MDYKDTYFTLINFLSEVDFGLTKDDKLWFNCNESKLKIVLHPDSKVHDNFTKREEGGFKLTETDNKILGFLLYPSLDNFHNKPRNFIKNRNPTIVFDNKKSIFHGYFKDTYYQNKEKLNSSSESFFRKILDYSEFENLWISLGSKSDSEDLFNFIDHYDTSKDSFLLVSSGTKAVIKKPKKFETFKGELDLIDTERNLQKFKESIDDEKDKILHFLKNEIIKRSKSNSNNLLKIFWSFEDIHSSAYKAYLIFIEDISLEKLQNEYDEFKNEYLKTYSDLISKILFKIISAPITFGAVTFALSRIQNNVLILALLIGLVATSILIYFSLKSHLFDLITITQQLQSKCRQIKNLEFFKNNDDELNELEKYLDLIKDKIKLAVTFLISSFLLTFLFSSIIEIYPIYNKILNFLKDLPFQAFNGYEITNLILLIVLIIYSILILCNNFKRVKDLRINAKDLSFK